MKSSEIVRRRIGGGGGASPPLIPDERVQMRRRRRRRKNEQTPETATTTTTTFENSVLQWLLQSRRHATTTSIRSLNHLKETHLRIIRAGLHHSNIAVKILILHCSALNHILYASRLLHHLPHPTPSTFTLLLRSSSPHHTHCFSIFNLMRRTHLLHHHHLAIPYLLHACTRLNQHPAGRSIHACSIALGLHPDSFIRTTLIRFYSSFHDLPSCLRLFHQPFPNDPFLWTATISLLLNQSNSLHAAHTLFDSMPAKDVVAWNTMVSGYINRGNIGTARMLFDEAPVKDLLLKNTMLGGYARHGNVDVMLRFFHGMEEKDTVSWNSVILGLVRSSMLRKAMHYFQLMRIHGFCPGEATMVTLLSACSSSSIDGGLEFGKWLHSYVDGGSLSSSTAVMTAVVDMYAKCGDPESCERVFDMIGRRDVVCWNVMIMAMALNGRSGRAMAYFQRMTTTTMRGEEEDNGEGVRPNDGTIVGVLCACRHGGLVEEGRRVFVNMYEWYGLRPKSEHYCCMVDLLGRAGLVREAYELILSMDGRPTGNVWGALLSGCRACGDVEVAEMAAQRMVEMGGFEGGQLSLMCDVYGGVDRWDGALRMRGVIEEKGVGKLKGCSFVEIGSGGGGEVSQQDL